MVIKNHEPQKIIDQIFTLGLDEIRNRYYQDEIAIPELLLSMQLLMDLLSRIDIKQTEKKRDNKIVLGVIEGDPHDLGKNIIKKIVSYSKTMVKLIFNLQKGFIYV